MRICVASQSHIGYYCSSKDLSDKLLEVSKKALLGTGDHIVNDIPCDLFVQSRLMS